MINNMDDLDRYIQGQIEFEDIQGCINENISIREAIIDAAGKYSNFSNEEHVLYEKLCYADVLLYTKYNGAQPYNIYAFYLFQKKISSPHKLDWARLLEKIKRESGMNYQDILSGKSIYKNCLKRGGNYRDLFP